MVTVTTPYSPFTSLPRLLEHRAEHAADQVGLVVHGEPYTYEALWRRSGSVQSWLRSAGVRRGDHVALFLRNSIEFVDSWIALARMGAVAVPVNTSTVGEALHHTLDHSESVGVIGHADLLPAVDAAGPLEALRWRAAVDGTPETTAVPFAELLDRADSDPAPVKVDGLDPMNIIYTSGTTGLPKGVVLPHLSYVNTGGYFAHHFGLTPDDVLHTCLPLFHCNAQQTTLMAGLHLGARVVVDRSFSLSRFWTWILRSEATVTNLLGAMLALLSKRPESAEERANLLRYVVAAPVPEDLHRPLEARFGVRIVEGYGLSETGTMACINPPDDRRSGTIGRPLAHNELRIVDAHGEDVQDGVPGEILTRTQIPGAYMTGYFKEPDKTAEAMAGGWFHTGDVGKRREDGYYVFVDRLKDTIRRRGENISSFLVEKAVLSHPNVAEVAAVGVPSELSEEDVKIIVVRRHGATLSEAELAEYCESRLADFMRPRYVEFRDELPRTETGRVQKYLLRKEGVGAAWDRDQRQVSRA
ncbi:AMP-binding protein [Actinokineospora sp.]|uniref:AMP-binding protein n=1 Tax=Actinokineospora sp. TaxID=1872133 RepID=UPI003D6BF3A7